MPLSNEEADVIARKFVSEAWAWISLICFMVCATAVGIVWMIWGRD